MEFIDIKLRAWMARSRCKTRTRGGGEGGRIVVHAMALCWSLWSWWWWWFPTENKKAGDAARGADLPGSAFSKNWYNLLPGPEASAALSRFVPHANDMYISPGLRSIPNLYAFVKPQKHGYVLRATLSPLYWEIRESWKVFSFVRRMNWEEYDMRRARLTLFLFILPTAFPIIFRGLANPFYP